MALLEPGRRRRRAELLLIAIVAALASTLALDSGFGLGTLLLPAFAILPALLAVAATGIVHRLNNLFKGALLSGKADWPLVQRLSLPSAPAATFGARLLARLGEAP